MSNSPRSVFRFMRSFSSNLGGCIILIAVLLSSCTQTDAMVSDLSKNEQETIMASDTLPLLRFSSIAQLEALTRAELPGYENQNEWEISQLTYECVDTIEMRALIFNVKALLTSAVSGRVRTVELKSEVGPELVSVEYYPIVDVIPAHHNLSHAFYFSVQRFRNYSDGSRIGPDEFYDYGHPIECYEPEITIEASEFCPHSLGGEHYMIKYFTDDGNINPEWQSYSNGTFVMRWAKEFYFNINASIVWLDGKRFSGDDMLPIIIAPNFNIKSLYENPSRLAMYPRTVVDFYHPQFKLHRGFNMSDPESAEMATMCKNVPDKSPVSFPKDNLNRSPGFYVSLHDNECIAPNYESLRYGYCDDINFSIPFYGEALSHHSYLIIDGRIIHYPSDMDLTPVGSRISRTKQGSTYKFTRTTTFTGFGERWEFIEDTYIRGVNGAETVYTLNPDVDYLDRGINNELNSRSLTKEKLVHNIETDKLMEIDRFLPVSLRHTPTCKTIVHSSK